MTPADVDRARRAKVLVDVALAALDRFAITISQLKDVRARADLAERIALAKRTIQLELPLFLDLATQTEGELRGDAFVVNAIFEARGLHPNADPVELAHAVIKRLRDPEPPPTSPPDSL